MLLPTLGVIIAPLTFAWVFATWAPFMSAGMWEAMPYAVVGDAWRSTAKLILAGTMAVTVMLLVAYVLAIVLLFRKRTSFPITFIVLSWISVIYGALFSLWIVMSGLDTETKNEQLVADIIKEAAFAFLWTGYMLQSKRVGATFVTRVPQRSPVVTSDVARAG
jgi:hypothetical protein